MKKILGLISLVLFAYVGSFAVPVTAPTLYGPVIADVVPRTTLGAAQTNVSNSAWEYSNASGTSITSTASITLFSKVPIERGYNYFINFKDSTGTSGTVNVYYTIYGSDNKTQMTASTLFDTLDAAGTYQNVDLPINKTAFGNLFTITLTGVTAEVKKIYRAELYRVKTSLVK
jgi:hypothetical protein